MALTSKINRRPQSGRGQGRYAPLPHPSWRLATTPPVAAEARIGSASEFWSKLGL